MQFKPMRNVDYWLDFKYNHKLFQRAVRTLSISCRIDDFRAEKFVLIFRVKFELIIAKPKKKSGDRILLCPSLLETKPSGNKF